MSNSKTFNVALTSQQAADYMRSLCGDTGTDVLAHLISVVGTNREALLGHMFQTLDPSFGSNYPQVGASVIRKNSGFATRNGERPYSKAVIIDVDPLNMSNPLSIEYYGIQKDGVVKTERHDSGKMSIDDWNKFIVNNINTKEELDKWVEVPVKPA